MRSLAAVWHALTPLVRLLLLQIGVSVFAGVAAMLVLIPFQAKLTKRQLALQGNLMKVKDARVTLVNETINSVKLIKFCAWERDFLSRITKVRDEELTQLKRYMLMKALSSLSWTAVPLSVSLVTFGVYTALGNELTASK